MDVSCYVRCTDLTDSKENKKAGRVGNASAGRPLKSLILWELAERVGFSPGVLVHLLSSATYRYNTDKSRALRFTIGRNFNHWNLYRTNFRRLSTPTDTNEFQALLLLQ